MQTHFSCGTLQARYALSPHTSQQSGTGCLGPGQRPSVGEAGNLPLPGLHGTDNRLRAVADMDMLDNLHPVPPQAH